MEMHILRDQIEVHARLFDTLEFITLFSYTFKNHICANIGPNFD